MEGTAGWGWFAAWGLAGGLVFFSILAGFSIGLFVLPFAALAVWYVGRHAGWPEGLGAVVGAGAVCLAVAALNWDYTACPEGPITLPPGATSFTCGGTSPWPWLLAGSVLALGAPLAYLLLRKRRPPRPLLVTRLSRREKIFLALIAVLAALALLTLVSFVVLSSGSGEIRIEQSPPVGVP